MEITRDFLINALLEDAYSDVKTGYNAALIKVLKHLVSGTVSEPEEVELKCLKAAFAQTGHGNEFQCLPKGVVDELIALLKKRSKLDSVKLIKQYSELGLKESKDVVDTYYVYMG